MVAPVPAAPVARVRPDTRERWQAAAARAAAEGVTIRQLAGCGMWIATSGTQAGVAYEVTWTGCECHAALHGDPVCKHRAALRLRFGGIVLPEPEPPAPAMVVVRVVEERCHNCDGHGWRYGTVDGGHFDRVTCWVCGGAGVEPATALAA